MRVRLNGAEHEAEVEPRTLLSDFIRDQGLTGTKVGCEHGVCGACTVQLDGEPVRSCLTLAVQADGCDVRPSRASRTARCRQPSTSTTRSSAASAPRAS